MKVKSVRNVSNEAVNVKLENGGVCEMKPGEMFKNLNMASEAVSDSRLQIVQDLGEIVR